METQINVSQIKYQQMNNDIAIENEILQQDESELATLKQQEKSLNSKIKALDKQTKSMYRQCIKCNIYHTCM